MDHGWYKVGLTREQILAGELEQIRAELSRIFLVMHAPDQLAVFTRRRWTGGWDVYFSPKCTPFAEFIFERHAATPCRAPDLLGTTLLIGYRASVSWLLSKTYHYPRPKEVIRKKAVMLS